MYNSQQRKTGEVESGYFASPQVSYLPFPKRQPKIQIEEAILLIGSVCFMMFLGIIVFLMFPLLMSSPAVKDNHAPVAMAQVEPTSTFTLPPTWTPTVTPVVIPTMVSTPVFTGRLAAHLHQPRDPTSPMYIQLPPAFSFPVTERQEVLDLARIMQGESTGDKEAAYMVGWVAKNRHRNGGYGRTYYEVSSGFFGYRAGIQPSQEFMKIAERVIRSGRDPTGGCLYALSRTDITYLGVPASRADVAFGEWFFFRTWPLG
jgi:hypothetical protein